ncbi:MAG: hypothetical protein HFE84_00650 [Lachnospiraceae bacterium]|nr:hypothetical protein [Lachnospiraceae bacterium]
MENNKEKLEIKWTAWVALAVLILMVSGLFKDSTGPLKAFDFTNLTGAFGKISENLTFLGKDGSGAKDGFLQALNIAPVVILFCGIMDVCQEFGALAASSVLFQPILKPLMGIPGTTGLALVGSFTSVDVGAVMTKELRETEKITDDELTIFVAYQNAGSAIITNLLTTGASLMAVIPYSFGFMFVLCMSCKIFGANFMRIFLAMKGNRRQIQ